MKQITAVRLRKCSDVDMEYPLLEVLDENGVAFMDISKSDDGELRILFYPEASSRWMTLESLEGIVAEGKEALR